MTIFIGIAVIACIAGLYVKVWGKRLEEVLPLSMFSVIFLIYLAGIFGNLKIGFYAAAAAGGLSGLACLYFLWKEKGKYLQNVLTPGCIVFFALAVVFWWTNEGRLLQQWDDFSHWGLVVKNMCIFQKFGNIPQATVKFTDYPPAASIFSYFFTSFGSYSETNAIRGMCILTAGMLLPVFKNIKWNDRKTWISGGLLAIMVYVLPTSFHKNAYMGLYVDSLLGVLFFFLVYFMVTYEAGWFRTVNLTAGCMILALTKSSGTGLAGIALGFVMGGLLLVDKNKKARLRMLLDMVICGAGLLLAQKSWQVYLKLSGTQKGWSSSELSLSGILEIFKGTAPEYRMTTVKNFGSFLLKEPMGGWLIEFPVVVWVLLFIGFAMLFVHFCAPQDRKSYIAVFTGLNLGFVGYAGFLLILYLFSYSEFEAMNLASCDRYLWTYILGMLCSYVLLFVNYFKRRTVLVHVLALTAVLLCITKEGIFDIILYPEESIITSQWLEEGYQGSRRFQNKLDYNEDKVYVISQNNNGLDYWMLRGVFTPVKINENYTWSIGEKYGPGDVYTAYKNIYSWSYDLKEFDYVYLFRVDDEFREQFGALFEDPEDIQNDTMFTIVHGESEDSLVRLILNEEMTQY